jgi:hypothetical protein
MCRAAFKITSSIPSRSLPDMSNRIVVGLVLSLPFLFPLAGCAVKPVTRTQVIEKPFAVPCLVEAPAECKPVYAVDRVSIRDDPLTINRALRAEIEERRACEVKLIAALKGCNNDM